MTGGFPSNSGYQALLAGPSPPQRHFAPSTHSISTAANRTPASESLRDLPPQNWTIFDLRS
jgi:hypothetical protein